MSPSPLHITVDGRRISGEVRPAGEALEVRITGPFAGPRAQVPLAPLAASPVATEAALEARLAALFRAGLPAGGADVVRFAHGKDSGPWGLKVQRLAPIAERLGFAVESPDYTWTMDPDERVERLRGLGSPAGTLVLVGSSMGAYVSTVASAGLRPAGLFLLAPAVYLDGYAELDPTPRAGQVEVVHGWADAVVPVDHAIRFAERHRDWVPLRLHLLPDGHPLAESIPELEALFEAFLRRVRARV